MLKVRSRKSTIIFIVMTVAVIISLAVGGFFAIKYFELQKNPNQAAEVQTKRLTDAVGKLYELPKDETPIIGKVNNKEKLKDQPFFAAAKKDDDILMYQKARIAIIYRSSENKLVNVGPIAINALPEAKK